VANNITKHTREMKCPSGTRRGKSYALEVRKASLLVHMRHHHLCHNQTPPQSTLGRSGSTGHQIWRGNLREELQEGVDWILRPGRPGCAVVGADEVEDGLGGLDEVGMAGDLGVRLRLLHAPQLRTAVTAPQWEPRHCCRRSDQLEFASCPAADLGAETTNKLQSVLNDSPPVAAPCLSSPDLHFPSHQIAGSKGDDDESMGNARDRGARR